MYIRRTKTNNAASGETYFTYRLVRGERIGGKVRQVTVLNLGRNFAFDQDEWPSLCSRIEQLLSHQTGIESIACSDPLEKAAQHYASQLITRRAAVAASEATEASGAPDSSAEDLQTVDLNSLELTQPRSVGVEHVALEAVRQLGLVDKLTELGVNGVMRASILGNLIARMAVPASELASWGWLVDHSALGELLDVDYASLSHMRLYRASDILMKHREALP